MELKKSKLKINSWKECSISDYFKLKRITEDETLEPYDKEISIISILSGKTEEEVLDLTITEFKDIQAKTTWISEATLRRLDKIKFSNIELNGEKYYVDTDLSKFTVGQYIDFQTFWKQKDEESNISHLLACFIIPKGKKYGEDYDLNAVNSDIMNFLDIQTAYEILGFFLMRWVSSTRNSLDFLLQKTKKMMKKKMSQEELNQRIAEIEDLKKNISYGFQLLI